jgi:hypothetical protein
MISSPAAKPVVDATVICMPVGLAVTAVATPPTLEMFVEVEMVIAPSAPVPLSGARTDDLAIEILSP